MELLESRGLRVLLLIVTAVVLFTAIRGCANEATDSQSRAEASEDQIDNVEIPTTVPPTVAPLVIDATPIPGSEGPGELLQYPVEPGDILSDIAIKFNTSVTDIRRANPGLDPNSLSVGQVLRIPGATIEPTEEVDPEDREPGVSTPYFVELGDTLGEIAGTYTVSSDAILEANPGLDAGALQVGQEIVIPPLGTGLDPSVLTPEPTRVVVDREPGETLTYTVVAGDSLVAIAADYGVTVISIMGANGLENANEIQAGDELLIPPPTITN